MWRLLSRSEANSKNMKQNIAVEEFLAGRRVVIAKFVTHRHKEVQNKAKKVVGIVNLYEVQCADVLLSKHVAEDLEQYAHWQPHLHNLGECEVKHGARVYLVNLYTEELGNPEVPVKIQQAKDTQTAPAIPASDTKPARRSWAWITAPIIVAVAAAIGSYIFSHRSNSKAPPSSTASAGPAIQEKSIAVLPFENRSRDPDNAYFADGIQDEILTRLSKIADLKIRTEWGLWLERPHIA
jgi:hypothetical protein